MRGLKRLVPIVLLLFGVARIAAAKLPDESEFLAASVTGEDVALWLEKMERRPKSIGLFVVHANAPMEADYGAVVETEIRKQLRNRGMIQLTPCPECQTPQITLQGDRLIITKGAPDLDTLRGLGKKAAVDAFLVLEVYRTKISVITEASLYQTASGELLSAETFRVPAINFFDAAMQTMLLVGPGFVAGNGGDSSGLCMAANLMALEELGFAKGGITFGSFFGNGNAVGYILPTLGFRGRFGPSALTYLFGLGGGFAFSGSGKGVGGRASFDIFLGSLAVMGFEATFYAPINSSGDTVRFYGGMHVGVSIGR